MENRYVFTEMDQYYFGHATHYDLYMKLGAHPTEINGQKGTYFAVWAPNAKSVSVVGDFNGWNTVANVIPDKDEIGVWQIFIPGVMPGAMYKYYIVGAKDQQLYKADPYAFQAEKRPHTASRTADLTGYTWGDAAWMKKRKTRSGRETPLNIYEMHLGSWRRDAKGGFLSYGEIADTLIPYAAEMG